MKLRIMAIVMTLVLLSATVVIGLADVVVEINSVEFEEYSDIYGERDKHTVRTKISYTVPEDCESVSVAFLGKNTSDQEEFVQNVIYIDQIDDPTGEYEFLIERSRIQQVLGTSDIEGKTLYLKMGASGANEADVFEVTYNTPTCMMFEGAQIRINEPQGLRFIFSIPVSVYETLEHPKTPEDTGLGFGSVVLPKKYLGDEKLVKDLEIVTDKKVQKAKTAPAVNLFKVTDDFIYFTVCLLEIDEENFTTEYTSVPYITYMDEGEMITEYGMQTNNVSVYSVAELCYNDENSTEEEKEYLYKNILSVVDSEKYPIK